MKVKQNMGETNRGGTGRGRRMSSRASLNEGDPLIENKEALLPFISNNAMKAESPSTFSMDSPMDSEHSFPMSLDEIKKEDLTPDDANRRKRRRERNKVAATKCRNKKKARTQLLMKESETLVVQNQNLKTEIQKLEKEKLRLMQVLSGHENACVHHVEGLDQNVAIKCEDLPMLITEDEFSEPGTVPSMAPAQSSLNPALTNSQSVTSLPSNNLLNVAAYATSPISTPFNIPNIYPAQSFMSSGLKRDGTISASSQQPPSFDDAVMMAGQVKSEEVLPQQEQQSILQQDHHPTIQQDHHTLQQPSIFQGHHTTTQHEINDNHEFFRAAAFGYNITDTTSSHFLAKRPLGGHTYLDLDSRCIAL